MPFSLGKRAVLIGGVCWAVPLAQALAQGMTDPADLAYWEAIKDSQDAADYRDYLARFPNGTFAPLARSRAARLAAGGAGAAPAGLQRVPAQGQQPGPPQPEPDPATTVAEQLIVTPNPARVGDKIKVAFKNISRGGTYDFVTIVRAGAPENNPEQSRDDMKNLTLQYINSYLDQGYVELGPFAPGRFEARYVTTLYNDDRKPEIRTKTIFVVR